MSKNEKYESANNESDDKEKQPININKVFEAIIFIGGAVLALLIIASLIGVIITLAYDRIDLLTVMSSVFVASLSSLLTIAALFLTLKIAESDYRFKMNDKNFLLQSSLRAIKNSARLSVIKIYKNLVPNSITHTNSYAEDLKRNHLIMTLMLSADELNNIQQIKLNSFSLCTLNSKKRMSINIDKGDKFLSDIKPIDSEKFEYKITVPVDYSGYKHFNQLINSGKMCRIKVEINFDLMHVQGARVSCKPSQIFTFTCIDSKEKNYIFTL